MAQVRVCQCRDAMEAHFVRALMEAEGIRVSVVGESLGQLAGGIPAAAARPELWVEAADAERTVGVLNDARAGRWARAAGEWVCPNCAERIEGQFTECWKCRTSRPAGEQELSDPVSTDVEPVVGADVRCRGCGYNLRGVPATHRCPECGKGIFTSLTAAWRAADDPERRAIREVVRYVAAGLGYPVEAVLFLLGAYATMAERIGREPVEADVRAIDGRLFCAAIGWAAVQQFGTPERAKEILGGWGITGGRDVGRVLAVAWDVPAEAAERAFGNSFALDQWF